VSVQKITRNYERKQLHVSRNYDVEVKKIAHFFVTHFEFRAFYTELGWSHNYESL
jgi:hypothetical protein